MNNWKSAGITTEGKDFMLGGINVWKHKWSRLAEDPVELPHPSYPNQVHKMWQYEIQEGSKRVQFAAGELSAGVYGFYVHA